MGTRIKTRITPKIRVMSFVMAFVILVVSLPIWIGNTGTKVKAADLTDDGNHIYSDTKTTTMTAMGNGHTSANDSRFVYTGKITKAQTELFDYVSDYELINNSYNSILHTEGGYDDAYTSFNNAISQSNNAATPLHAANKNVTITLTTTSFDRDVYVYLWNVDGSGTKTADTPWPGKKMTYDSVNNCFTYTFNRDNSNSPYYLNFLPNRLIFTDGYGNKSGDITISSPTVGKTYAYSYDGGTKIKYCYNNKNQNATATDGFNVHYWMDSDYTTEWPGVQMTTPADLNDDYVYEIDTSELGYIPTRFLIHNNGSSFQTSDLPYDNDNAITTRGFIYYVYKSSPESQAITVASVPAGEFNLVSSNTSAQNIYNTKYTYPLYFGCFWRSNTADASSTTNYPSSNNPGYLSTNKPGSNFSYGPYNDFWWQINMGLKTINDDNDESSTNHFRVRGTASTQGLVYNSLNNNDNLVDINGTTELPYFDKTSSLVTDGLMKYYDKDETGDNIHFPFYEVKANAQSYVGNGNLETEIAGEYKAYSGSGTATTQFAKFYQFDSKESNVRFEIAQNESNVEDPSLHKGHFVETTQAITHGGKAGYFPFNNINTNNEKKHNLGVGTKFEMTFKLQPDGCVGVVDSSGNDLDTNDYKTRVYKFSWRYSRKLFCVFGYYILFHLYLLILGLYNDVVYRICLNYTVAEVHKFSGVECLIYDISLLLCIVVKYGFGFIGVVLIINRTFCIVNRWCICCVCNLHIFDIYMSRNRAAHGTSVIVSSGIPCIVCFFALFVIIITIHNNVVPNTENKLFYGYGVQFQQFLFLHRNIGVNDIEFLVVINRGIFQYQSYKATH